MNLKSLTPRPKVAAGGVASAVVVIVLYLANLYGWPLPDWLPQVDEATLGAVLAGAISFAAGWLKAEPKEIVTIPPATNEP